MRTDRWNSAILRQRIECSETIQLIDRIKVSFLERIATLGCHGVLARFSVSIHSARPLLLYKGKCFSFHRAF